MFTFHTEEIFHVGIRQDVEGKRQEEPPQHSSLFSLFRKKTMLRSGSSSLPTLVQDRHMVDEEQKERNLVHLCVILLQEFSPSSSLFFVFKTEEGEGGRENSLLKREFSIGSAFLLLESCRVSFLIIDSSPERRNLPMHSSSYSLLERNKEEESRKSVGVTAFATQDQVVCRKYAVAHYSLSGGHIRG